MRTRANCIVLTILLTSCTTSPNEPAAGSADSVEASTTNPEAGDVQTTTTVAEDDEAAEDTGSSSVEPFRPHDKNQTTTTGDQVTKSAYISRVTMSDSSIELTWSTSEDAVQYHLHRIPRTSDDRPRVEMMTAENRIHIADDAGRFVDDGVESGTRYWFGLRALSDNGELIAHGWHRADAVTDTVPPSPVRNLTAVVDDGEVLMTWTQPEENYELHGYKVLRRVDGEEPEALSTTWDLDQTSFIDDRPPASGNLVYSIVAFDFHWNNGEPAEVEIELAG